MVLLVFGNDKCLHIYEYVFIGSINVCKLESGIKSYANYWLGVEFKQHVLDGPLCFNILFLVNVLADLVKSNRNPTIQHQQQQ